MADQPVKKTLSVPGLDWSGWRKRFRVRPQGPVTALHVSGGVLRLVQATPRLTGPAITRVVTEALDLSPNADASDPTVLGAAIARALNRLRLKPASVVLGVPRGSVVLRTLTLPAVNDAREMASLVHFQIGRDLPFPADDAVIDFKVHREIAAGALVVEKADSAAAAGESATSAPAPVGKKLEVLAAAVKRDVVEFHLAAAEAAGIKVAALGLIPYANVRCVEACRLAEGTKALALVLLRANEVSIDVIAGDALLFSRDAAIQVHEEPTPAATATESPPEEAPVAAPVPEEAMAAAAAVSPEASEAAPATPAVPASPVERITIEVVRSLTGFGGMDPANTVARIVVAGDTGMEDAVVEALEKRMNLAVQRLNPMRALSLPEFMETPAAGAISALGLALGVLDRDGLPFDFLKPKRPAVQRNMKRIRLFMAAAAAVAAIVLLLAVRTQLLKRKDAALAAINADVRKEEKMRPLYRMMVRQAATLRDWVGDRRHWLDHYAYLSAILPPSEEVYLDSFSINNSGTITLAVQARSGAILAKLDKQLRAAGYEVKPLAVTPGADRHGYNFKSTVELSVPAKFKMDLAKVHPAARLADDVSLEVAPPARRGGGS